MNTQDRETVYLRDRAGLTPAQRRRIRHKENERERVTLDGTRVPRYARLRKRMERKDNRRLRREGSRIVAWVNARRANNGKPLVGEDGAK